MVKSAYTYQVFSRLKSTFWVLQNQLTRYTSSHNSAYAIVTPKKVSSQRSVPSHIQKPPYVSTTPGKDACPPHIEIHSPEQISKIKEACILARKILNLTAKELKVGITTDNIDEIVHQLCIDNNVYPSPLGYLGYPKSVCTSINNVACHGIPDSRPLQDSDIINIDVTVYANGYHGDVSETYLIGNVDDRGQKLVDTTHLEKLARESDFCGHGIGTYFHGLPDIFHIDLGDNAQMEKGMVFTIEPVICDGKPDIKILPDGWTALTKDNSRSAQFEHCIAIIENGAEILTL
ncbi:map [Acanthosepion pharaonis]|uniref:Map n=1 Tax=Acanthosepion pharaonis TaxID=158019 RepID=A0A812D046_ACAPH|nr:map [Sepia pharaonis]